MARTPRRRATAPSSAGNPGGDAAARRVRENLPRPTAPSAPRPTATSAAPAVRRRRSPFGFLSRFQPRFVADIISELRKVTWPSLAETRYLTMVVAIVAIVVGAILGTVDLLFGWVIEQLFF